MPSARHLALLLPVLLAATGAWLWHSGEWRTLAALLPQSGVATAAGPVTDNPPPAPVRPGAIRTWTDADGVVHFEQATASAPAGAAGYAPRKAATLADYEAELQAREGISIEDVARARAARQQAAAGGSPDASVDTLAAADGAVPARHGAAPRTTAGQPGDASEPGDVTSVATRQARELLQQYRDNLEQMRAANHKQ